MTEIDTLKIKLADSAGLALAARYVMIDDERWYVTADILEALNGPLTARRSANTYAEVMRLDEFGRTTMSFTDARELGLAAIAHPKHGLCLVTEGGLFSLILRSNRLAARPLQNWLTRRVIPAIRAHGAYANELTPALRQFGDRPNWLGQGTPTVDVSGGVLLISPTAF